jgi:hypothetical protein
MSAELVSQSMSSRGTCAANTLLYPAPLKADSYIATGLAKAQYQCFVAIHKALLSGGKTTSEVCAIAQILLFELPFVYQFFFISTR